MVDQALIRYHDWWLAGDVCDKIRSVSGDRGRRAGMEIVKPPDELRAELGRSLWDVSFWSSDQNIDIHHT